MSTPFWPDVSLLFLYHHWQIAQAENMSSFDDFSASSINLNNYVPEESQCALLSSSFQIIVQLLLHTVKWFLFSLLTPFHPHTTTSYLTEMHGWSYHWLLVLETTESHFLISSKKKMLKLFTLPDVRNPVIARPLITSPPSSTYLLYVYQRHKITAISQHMTF